MLNAVGLLQGPSVAVQMSASAFLAAWHLPTQALLTHGPVWDLLPAELVF